MKQNVTERFIKKKVDVQEAGKARTHGKGEKREDYEAMWNTTGRVLLVGLPGSGRFDLAAILGERLGLPVLTPEKGEAFEAACLREKSIVVVPDTVFDDESLIEKVKGAGKVFYLMTDAQTLTRRVLERSGEVGDEDALWREVSDRLAVLEPRFMSALHFILQGVQTPDALVDDALEKISW